jgi:hypothetical protein
MHHKANDDSERKHAAFPSSTAAKPDGQHLRRRVLQVVLGFLVDPFDSVVQLLQRLLAGKDASSALASGEPCAVEKDRLSHLRVGD